MCVLPFQVTLAQTEFQSGHFRTSDGVELRYLEAGTGPTLVLVPGWTMPAEIWQHQIRHFASMYRVVALDPRALDIGELLEHIGGEPGKFDGQ